MKVPRDAKHLVISYCMAINGEGPGVDLPRHPDPLFLHGCCMVAACLGMCLLVSAMRLLLIAEAVKEGFVSRKLLTVLL